MAPDPRKSFYTYITGIKGSGKSEYARWQAYSYPFDRLIIDVTHDITELMLRPHGIPHHQITKPIPGSWPEWMRDDTDQQTSIPGAHRPGQMTLVFRPDMGDPEAFDDMDRALGIAMRGRGQPTLAWLDEIGEQTTAHRTGPNAKRALHHGRHLDLSLLMAGPRSQDVNPLCIGNSDKVVCFRILNSDDREAVCRKLGTDQREFDDTNKRLQRYHHMVWERERQMDMPDDPWELMGPLPLYRRGRNPPVELG